MLANIKGKIIALCALTSLVAGMVSAVTVVCVQCCCGSKKCKKAFKQIEDKLT